MTDASSSNLLHDPIKSSIDDATAETAASSASTPPPRKESASADPSWFGLKALVVVESPSLRLGDTSVTRMLSGFPGSLHGPVLALRMTRQPDSRLFLVPAILLEMATALERRIRRSRDGVSPCHSGPVSLLFWALSTSQLAHALTTLSGFDPLGYRNFQGLLLSKPCVVFSPASFPHGPLLG